MSALDFFEFQRFAQPRIFALEAATWRPVKKAPSTLEDFNILPLRCSKWWTSLKFGLPPCQILFRKATSTKNIQMRSKSPSTISLLASIVLLWYLSTVNNSYTFIHSNCHNLKTKMFALCQALRSNVSGKRLVCSDVAQLPSHVPRFWVVWVTPTSPSSRRRSSRAASTLPSCRHTVCRSTSSTLKRILWKISESR